MKTLPKEDKRVLDLKSIEINMKKIMDRHNFAMQEQKLFMGYIISFLQRQIVYSFKQPVILEKSLYGVKVMDVQETDRNILMYIFQKLNPDIIYDGAHVYMKMTMFGANENLDTNSWLIKIAVIGFKIGLDGCPRPMLHVLDAKEVPDIKSVCI